ncbi:MAG: hypothetical protein FWD46_08565 [Cystobacterineae bacterium]|nr:hypothetical protein [Cystobacterineae bacterium]
MPMTLRLPALFSGLGFLLTLWFVFNLHSPMALALFTFVAQPCFLVGFILWLVRVKTDLKQKEVL